MRTIRRSPAAVLLIPAILVALTFYYNVVRAAPVIVPGLWFNFPHGTPGLPSATAGSSTVDSLGRVWMGLSGSGIAVYDGLTWKTYSTADGLVSNTVREITAWGESVWVGTGSGASLFNPASNTWTTYNTTSGLPANSVRAIAPRTSGPIASVFFGTNGQGVAECELVFPDDLTCAYYKVSNTDLLSDFVKDIVIAANGDVWIATGLGVNRKSGSTWTSYGAGTSGCSVINSSSEIAIDDKNGRIWVALANPLDDVDPVSGDGLCMYETATNTWHLFNTSNSGLGDNTVNGQAVDGEGRAWMVGSVSGGFGGGIHVCSWIGGQCYWKAYTTADGLLHQSVFSAVADGERIYFGTFGGVSTFALRWQRFIEGTFALTVAGGKLYIGEPNALRVYDGAAINTLIPGVRVRALLADAAGSIWAATDADGLWRVDGGGNVQFRTDNSGLASNELRALALDMQGRIWVGTGGAGISVYDPVAQTWSTIDASVGLPSNDVRAFAVQADGTIWIGTAAGLVRYTGSAFTVTTTPTLPGNVVQALALDAAARLWVGTNAGAARFDGVTWQIFKKAQGLPANNILALYAAPSGDVVLGTVDGAARYDGSAFTAYGIANSGLLTTGVRAITGDDEGVLWFGGVTSNEGDVQVAGGLYARSSSDVPLGQPSPVISAITPLAAPSGSSIRIDGSNFAPGSEVYFAGNLRATVTSLTDKRIDVVVSPNALFGPIHVKNSGGTATSAQNFSPLPQISMVRPLSGAIGSLVSIDGTNLASPGFTEVRFGSGSFSSLAVVQERGTYLRVRIPPDATDGPVQVRTPAGTATSSTSFALVKPGLVIFGADVHQGLPGYPLVAEKTTVVRVFVGTSNASACAFVDNAVLQVFAPGEGTPRLYTADVDDDTIPNNGVFCNTRKQVTADGSIDFVIDGEELTEGEYLMGVGLSSGFFPVGSRDLGRLIFRRTDDLRIHLTIPGKQIWDSTPLVWGLLDPPYADSNPTVLEGRQLWALDRVYPVRDGITALTASAPQERHDGLRYYFRPGGMPSGTEDESCNTTQFLMDFWQEDRDGVDRLCLVPNSLPKVTDNGSVMQFDLGTVSPSSNRIRTLLAYVRPGAQLPTNLSGLFKVTVEPANLPHTVVFTTTLRSDCGDTTTQGVLQVRIRFGDGANTYSNAKLTVDYDQTKLNTAGAGAMVPGNIAVGSWQTVHIPGPFFMPEGSRGAKYDRPLNFQNISPFPYQCFVAEYDDWDPQTGEFLTQPVIFSSVARAGDIIRNFVDANDNGAIDSGESRALFLAREDNVDEVVYDNPLASMFGFNNSSASLVDGQFSHFWLWDRVNPLDFMGLAGQAEGDASLWAEMAKSSAIIHEQGHLMGLNHAPARNVTGASYGYNTMEHRVVTTNDLMSGMGDPVVAPVEDVFFDPAQYLTLWWFLRRQYLEQTAASASPSGPMLQIGGVIGKDGRVSASTAVVAAGDVSLLDSASPYVVRLRSASAVLAEYHFPVDFTVDDYPEDGSALRERATFHVSQPFPVGANEVEIVYLSRVIWQRSLSAHAPSVTLTAPNGGQAFPATGLFTVAWNGSDPDGDPLSYYINYSRDGGATWQAIATNISGTSAELDLGSLPGGNTSLIEVVASDGFRTASDRSNALFSVGIKPPSAVILSPGAGEVRVQSQVVFLSGSAEDLEEGPLAPTALTWSSSRDGALGSGAVKTQVLSAGAHTITLTAKDASGASAAVSTLLQVAADFDVDGVSDSAENALGGLDWWNAADAGADPDGDGLTSRSEVAWATDPVNPDTDGDGVADGAEVATGSQPTNPQAKPRVPALLSGRSQLEFTGVAGGPAPALQPVALVQSLGGTVAWAAAGNTGWLQVQPAVGTTPGEAGIGVKIAGLAPGIYHGAVTVQAAATTPAQIAITLKVVDPNAPAVQLFLPTVRKQ